MSFSRSLLLQICHSLSRTAGHGVRERRRVALLSFGYGRQELHTMLYRIVGVTFAALRSKRSRCVRGRLSSKSCELLYSCAVLLAEAAAVLYDTKSSMEPELRGRI
jgi:hypothetical protein